MRLPDSAPVIIAACNEEELIGRTLQRLPTKGIEPIVAVNGSTDRTAEIARSFGAKVVLLEEPGKLPAQQEAVRRLAERGHQPNDPILFVDADTYPLVPKSWLGAMLRGHDRTNTPVFTSGLVGSTDSSLAVNALRTAKAYARAVNTAIRNPNGASNVYGANMAISFGTEAVRQQFLDMPHIWPGEDRATAQLIIDAGGTLHQSLDVRSAVVASSRYNLPFLSRYLHGNDHVAAHVESSYESRRAPGAAFTFVLGAENPLQPLPTLTTQANHSEAA